MKWESNQHTSVFKTKSNSVNSLKTTSTNTELIYLKYICFEMCK